MRVLKTILKPLVVTVLLVAICLSLVSCGYVEKSELGLNFVIPEDYERLYDFDLDEEELLEGDIKYGNGETMLVVHLKLYSDYDLTPDATVAECTEKIIDAMKFKNVMLTVDEENRRSQFDVWATQDGSVSYYNYITVLLSDSYIYIVKYVCAGSEKEMSKHKEDFVEMASKLSVR